MNDRTMIDPRYFLFSFIAVVVHYVLLFVGLLLALYLISRVAYPSVFELWNLPPKERQPFHDAWANTPEILFPVGLCWGLIVSGILISVALGISTAWWAPFSKSGHGVFLAVICIVSFLQISITQPQIPKWLMMGLLAGCSAGIVIGSRYGENWFYIPDQENDDEEVEARYDDDYSN